MNSLVLMMLLSSGSTFDQLVVGSCPKRPDGGIVVHGLSVSDQRDAVYSWLLVATAKSGGMLANDVTKVESLVGGVVRAPSPPKPWPDGLEPQPLLSLTLRGGRVVSLVLPYRMWQTVSCLIVVEP